jgi:hypothetical protein
MLHVIVAIRIQGIELTHEGRTPIIFIIHLSNAGPSYANNKPIQRAPQEAGRYLQPLVGSKQWSSFDQGVECQFFIEGSFILLYWRVAPLGRQCNAILEFNTGQSRVAITSISSI